MRAGIIACPQVSLLGVSLDHEIVPTLFGILVLSVTVSGCYI